MPLKVKKSVDMNDDYDYKQLTKLYDKLVLESVGLNVEAYDQTMLTLERILQRLVDKAFKLGQENPYENTTK